MRRTLTALLYLVLLAVVVSTSHSVWVGFVDSACYRAVFPGAQGLLYWTTLGASILAGVNSALIGLHKRWAIRWNPPIGLGSIALIEIVGGPRVNEAVVFVACTVSTATAWYLFGRRAPG